MHKYCSPTKFKSFFRIATFIWVWSHWYKYNILSFQKKFTKVGDRIHIYSFRIYKIMFPAILGSFQYLSNSPSCYFKNSYRLSKVNSYIPFKRWTTTWVYILWMSFDFTSYNFGMFWHLTRQDPVVSILNLMYVPLVNKYIKFCCIKASLTHD